jgi:asparagine synthase (glutamine-hydrolysing)
MCGIFALLNNRDVDYTKIFDFFMKGKSRGPDNSNMKTIESYPDSYIGFHRLSINGLNEISNQPIMDDGIILICNGEIYNYKTLYTENIDNFTNKTESDCEVIIHLYKKYGIDKTLNMIDGVFAFILIDTKEKLLFVARDTYGVRPLFKSSKNTDFTTQYQFASDIKQLLFDDVEQFTPGMYETYEFISGNWTQIHSDFFTPSTKLITEIKNMSIDMVLLNIRKTLENAVEKRVKNTDRPVACLLSGGLDSSLITSIVNKYYDKGVLETYSIGMPGSVDLKYAKIVADYLGTKHTEIQISENDFINAIPEVIENIETYDETTVRASIGNYLLGKYISNNSDAKVIFNGDGSDEVCGGYMYFHYTTTENQFNNECKRLLDDIRYFDVLRSDKSISSNGLEPRTPFLDTEFVLNYLSIDKTLRFNMHHNHCEKYLLRKAFDVDNYLPNEILWRTKEAFSDGVSSNSTGLYKLIPLFITENNLGNNEEEYYKSLFNKYFGEKRQNVIPYKWMPQFLNEQNKTTDSSAKTLKIYKNKQQST